MFAVELTLDETYNPREIEFRCKESKRLQKIHNLMVRRMFCMTLGEFVRDVKGMAPSSDGRKTYRYVVTDSDIDNLAKLIYRDLEDLAA